MRRNVLVASAAVALLSAGFVAVATEGSPRPAATTLQARLASATRVAQARRGGYWLVSAKGVVSHFGSAKFYGSMAGRYLKSPIIGIVATSDDRGYWLVAKDGGVFSFGDARFHGSLGDKTLKSPVVGMASSTAGASMAGPRGARGRVGAKGSKGVRGVRGVTGRQGRQGWKRRDR